MALTSATHEAAAAYCPFTHAALLQAVHMAISYIYLILAR